MEIRQIVGVSDQGVSRPYRCYDENGVLRWCKGNHTGLRSLVAEWVCARVAHDRSAVRQDVVDAFARDVRERVTEAFVEEVWSEMPTVWTEDGCGLTCGQIKGILLREDF